MTMMPGAEPYFLPGGKQGVLLIHGFTGTPAEMRLLGDFLQQAGYTVLSVLLPGHGTTPEELNTMTARDWFEEVERGYAVLSQVCDRVSVVGLSMGGLLALKAAAELPVHRAVFMSTPIYVFDWRAPFVSVAKCFLPWVKKARRPYNVEAKYSVAYEVMPLKALDSVLQLVAECAQNILPRITIPCLIIQAKHEHTVRPESAQFIYDRLPTSRKRIVWIEQSGHILTLSEDRLVVFQEILMFLQEK